uniref:Uncharacterized protein n=1 Tax=Lepeophtheirus salmonis TaxID=72036 RepID=A0A0K2TUQ3_LEPSM
MGLSQCLWSLNQPHLYYLSLLNIPNFRAPSIY